MWTVVCRTCAWTSGTRFLQEAAVVLGHLHEFQCPGHTVALTGLKASPSEQSTGANPECPSSHG